jgi:hypothetical protein
MMLSLKAIENICDKTAQFWQQGKILVDLAPGVNFTNLFLQCAKELA